MCNLCTNVLQESSETAMPVPANCKLLLEYCNMGGLKIPSADVYRLCLKCEDKNKLLTCVLAINENFISDILCASANISFPDCCGIKKKVIFH